MQHIDAALLVGADGTESFVRAQLGIETDIHDYAQTLFVCTVTPERDPANRAWERFSDEGPIAMLPLGRASLWASAHRPISIRSRGVAALDDAGFIALAQQRFGWRLGRLSRPGKRHPYAIRRVASRRLTATRAVLVGNAAQTVHPIGAQGFNLACATP